MAIRWNELAKGIFSENPVFISTLGVFPALAVANQTVNAFAMGLAVTFVIVFSHLTLSLIRNFIPKPARSIVFVLVTAVFVTIVHLFLKAYLPELSRSLGIYIPLIAVNCVVLERAETFAMNNGPVHSMLDALGMGIGLTLSIVLIALIREILGSGTIGLRTVISDPAAVMTMAPGGFLVMGILLAFLQFIRNKRGSMNKSKDDQ